MDFSSQVSLKASIGPVLSSTYTKGIGEIKSTDNRTLTIGLAKVHGASADFDGAIGCYEAVMGAPSTQNMGLRDIEFKEFQGFPDGTTTVNYVGWYPYEGSTFTNPDTGKSTVTFTVPADAYTDILYSNISSGTRLKGFNTMVFSHAFVKYSIKAYAMEANTDGSTVESVWGVPVKVELEKMPAVCELALPSSVNDAVTVNSTGEQTLSRDVAANGLQEGISNAKDLTYFLAPAPADDILRIKVTTKKGETEVVKSQTLSIAREFQPGKHYQIYLRFTTHGTINAEVTVEDWQAGGFVGVESNTGIYYDLSETHTANSYMVSSANRYCFNATVRGNGYTGAAGIPGAPTDIYKVGEPTTAEIIWTDLVSSTKENLDDYFSLVSKVEEGRVFFNVKSYNGAMKEGNVVVGVRDISGNLLWTWHLWLTDRPAEQGYKNGFAVQDRDMGATAYKPTGDQGTINGLYYQWGRPTPLPLGKKVYAPLSVPGDDGTLNREVVFTYDETADNANPPSIISRVKAPTTYFKAKATSSEGDLTKNLWGWRTETDEYAKTIYDPCPPGYRMPSIKLWRDLLIHNTTVADNSIKFQIDGNETVVYYPMNGFYTELGTLGGVNGAYMWAATFDLVDTNQPYGLDFIKVDNSTISKMQLVTEPSNHAMPVRCVSRMSKAHVTDLSDYQTANSYMVHKDGYYKFKATVRGNGIGQLVSPGSTSTIVLTEQLQSSDITNQLVKVEPLWWHTYDTAGPTLDKLNEGQHFILLNEGKPDADGYVSFYVQKWFEGNLILAGRDAKGDIIWSWHLWFTDEPEMKKSNSFVVMDRNLGATHAPKYPDEPSSSGLYETYGMYYQWGRKDPFMESAAIIYKYVYDSTKETYEYVAGTSQFSTESVATAKTVANSVANPMTFHLASDASANGGIFNNTNFFYSYEVTPEDNSMKNQCFSNMVHPENINSLWGYSAASGYGVTTTKTMYDPCPPGYIVSHYLVWTNTERNGYENYNYYSYLDTGWKWHKIGGTSGFFTTKHSQYFDPVWYPFGGYMNGKDASLNKRGSSGNGAMGIFHTSTPAGNGSRSLAYNSYYSGQIVDYSYRGLPSSFAYPVRCQKE